MASYNLYKPDIFKIKDDNLWKEYLDKYGYVVIENVLTQENIEKYFQQFAKDWKYVSPNFDFHNKDTWVIENTPMMWNKGMIYSSGLGQSDFQWMLRTDKNILEIWETLHNTNELVVSFDGFSIFLDKKQKPGMWLHVDQLSTDNIYSIQGAYNFFPVDENDSGFVVVPESHKTYKTKEPDDGKKRSNFDCLSKDDPHVEKAVKLLIPGNSFILWNSKTIHANVGMNKLSTRFNRLTSYICYFPKTQRDKSNLKKRMAGYFNGDNCGHFAIYHNIKRHPYGQKTRYEGRGFKNIEPTLTEDGNIPEERLRLI